MANRHLARTVALQSLYVWDFGGGFGKTSAEGDGARGETSAHRDGDLSETVGHAIKEFGPSLEDDAFVWQLVNGVIAKQPALDRVIENAAPEWSIDQITIVDRNILRLGLWELLFGNKKEVPPKVAINEAIELAKSFGAHSSGRFVNGVLGTVYRELGESGEQATEGENAEKRETLAGAIVFRKENGAVYLAMVKNIFGKWTFVKGHRNVSESAEAAALREMKEEIGLTGTVVAPLGDITYVAKEDGRSIKRNVTYYLVETNDSELTLEKSSGLKEALWVPLDEVKTLKHYENQDEIIGKAINLIGKAPIANRKS